MSRDITELAPVPADRRLRYGKEPSQFFDLFLPKNRTVLGAAMMIHGGFWRARYDLSHTSHMCAALAAEGIAIANLEYRRVGEPGGGWPGSFEDVLGGFDSVVKELGSPTIVLGHSAGGHLALRMAVERSPSAAIALAPVADLQMAYELNLSNGAAAEFVGGTPSSEPQRFEAADPMAHPSKVKRTLLHGTNDDEVPISLSEDFVRARADDPGEIRLIRIEGANHYDVIDPESASWGVVVRSALELLA
jgi:acetyl esterase/lipase